MAVVVPDHLLSVNPEEVKFRFQPDTKSYVDLEVRNNMNYNVAFRVRATEAATEKFHVRPCKGIVRPMCSEFIRVTLKAQKDLPPDHQLVDKFVIESTKVTHDFVDDLRQTTFNRIGGKRVDECQLPISYLQSSMQNVYAMHQKEILEQRVTHLEREQFSAKKLEVSLREQLEREQFSAKKVEKSLREQLEREQFSAKKVEESLREQLVMKHAISTCRFGLVICLSVLGGALVMHLLSK